MKKNIFLIISISIITVVAFAVTYYVLKQNILSSKSKPTAEQTSSELSDNPVIKPIGMATKLDDGSIYMRLHKTENNGTIYEGEITYKPDNPLYDKISKHVGDLKIGQHKSVKPWPN